MLSGLIWLIENTIWLIEPCQLLELFAGLLHLDTYAVGTPGMELGMERNSPPASASCLPGAEGRQAAEKAAGTTLFFHFILTKSFLLVLWSCQHLIVRINEGAQKH